MVKKFRAYANIVPPEGYEYSKTDKDNAFIEKIQRKVDNLRETTFGHEKELKQIERYLKETKFSPIELKFDIDKQFNAIKFEEEERKSLRKEISNRLKFMRKIKKYPEVSKNFLNATECRHPDPEVQESRTKYNRNLFTAKGIASETKGATAQDLKDVLSEINNIIEGTILRNDRNNPVKFKDGLRDKLFIEFSNLDRARRLRETLEERLDNNNMSNQYVDMVVRRENKKATSGKYKESTRTDMFKMGATRLKKMLDKTPEFDLEGAKKFMEKYGKDR